MTLTSLAPWLPFALCAVVLASSVTSLLRHRMEELRSGRLRHPARIRRRRRRHPLCEFMPPRTISAVPAKALSIEALQRTAHSRRIKGPRVTTPHDQRAGGSFGSEPPPQLTLVPGERRRQPRPGSDRRRGPLRLVS